MQLYDYQEPAMPRMLEILNDPGKRLALLAASTGYGKTYMALELIRRSSSSCAVLCPKITLGQWRSSASIVGVAPRFVVNPEKLRTGNQKQWLEKISDSSWNWVGLEDGDVVILDELHRFGGLDSQLAFMAACLSKRDVKVLGLTATLADSPLKTRFIQHQAKLTPWNSFFQWAKGVGCYRDTGINGAPWRPPYGKACRKVMEDLNAKLFPDFGVRLRSEDIPSFPEVLNVVDLVTPSEKARREIDAAYSMMADELKDPNKAKTALVRLLRWRQRIESEKLHVFKELVDDALEDGYSVVASFNFTDPLFEFRKMFARENPAMIYGSDPNGRQQADAEREAEKARFQSNRTRLLLLTIQAGGVGLSLGDELGGHPRLAFHNLPLDTTSLVQLLGRIHRADSKTKSVNRIVLVDGVAVEKTVFKILNRKIGNLSALQNDELDLEKLIGETE